MFFLHGILTETVYAEQPTSFTDSAHPDHVCHLNKSLYGVKQAPHAWYSRFASHLLTLGFVGLDMAYHRIISALTAKFSMKDMGPLHHFLGMSVTTHNGGLFLSQRQYMLEILE
jgi:hypothetical protein